MIGMIEIFNQTRGTGKTTSVIKLLEEDGDLYCIVPSHRQREFYPKHLQNRILHLGGNYHIDFQLQGKRITKVILDEGFAYREDKLAEIYYYLGYHRIHVKAFGTC